MTRAGAENNHNVKWGDRQRTIRVPDELWINAGYYSSLQNETVSQVIRRALQDYVEAGKNQFGQPDDE